LASALCVVSSCGLFPSLDDLTRGADAAAEAATDASSPDAPADADAGTIASDAGACTSLHGPAMVFVPTGAGGFCIDSTEVTTTDYAQFLDAISKGAPIATPPSGVCAWSSSVAPLTTTPCSTDTTDPVAHPNRPVSCVSWCDAYAYCAWAGKRICGAIDGGALPFGNVIGATNQSYVACSANGTQTYPYGSTYIKANCNTKDFYGDAGNNAVADVKGFPQCVGGFPGIYDIVGNVEEWLDSCDERNEGGANDPCHESGDCFDYVSTGPARCDSNDSDYRAARYPDVGIRCCSP
jgi:formylglycine-generating enzyme required for sulfatase activity